MLGILGGIVDLLKQAGSSIRTECIDVIEDAIGYLHVAFTPLIPDKGGNDTVIHQFRREVFRQELMVSIAESSESERNEDCYHVEHCMNKIVQLCKRVRGIRAENVAKRVSANGSSAVDFEREYLNHTDDTERIICRKPYSKNCGCDPESAWIEREKTEVLEKARVRGEGVDTIHHDDEKLQIQEIESMGRHLAGQSETCS